MKRLAVIAGGWHFPIAFFEQLAAQKIPEGWEVEMFLVSHRDPAYAVEEKKNLLPNLGYDRRGLYDRILYRKVATVAEIEALGWKYTLEPNTMGDWGNTNQWLEKNDYKKYDKFLITHDDNFILTDQMFRDILPQEDWLILTNSTGNAQRRLRQWFHLPKPLALRGSFEFFTREMMDLMGGKFDLSETTLTREGETATSGSFSELSDWNTTVFPLQRLIKEKGLESRVKALSQFYRMSIYCLEGERGYVHKTESSNTSEEEKGLDAVERHYEKKDKK
ncbi:MAG: hypothetical protein UY07_C0004G0007 [Parcubacteria group bacterium GW2011_GWA1_47_8]|nr:MAG: hypothetical protein UY07_C0004G0007 [Parcubacteria group bacterium GW2011_GWA1_47_8]